MLLRKLRTYLLPLYLLLLPLLLFDLTLLLLHPLELALRSLLGFAFRMCTCCFSLGLGLGLGLSLCGRAFLCRNLALLVMRRRKKAT